jgi:predicted O-methyltransferase YrrM
MNKYISDPVSDFYSSRYKFSKDNRKYDVLGGGALMPTEAEQLCELVKQFKLQVCIEVGTGFGASAVAICSAIKTNAVGHLWTLDPFQDEIFGNLGLEELNRLGFEGFYSYSKQYAEIFFSENMKLGKSFDLIFQDGAHNVGMKMTHAFLGDKALRAGGLFVFHDAFKPCSSACATYLTKELGYSVVHLKSDVPWKRNLRVLRHGFRRGLWFALKVAPHTHVNLVALRKPERI